MKKLIKEINFENKKAGKFHFDLVGLGDILKMKPTDHSQFNHHKLSFYVIIIITDNKGVHSINYKDYSYKKGAIFTLRKGNIHKFYKTKAKGKFLIFTENFIVRYLDKIEALKSFQLFNEMIGSPKLQLISSDFAEIENLIYQIEKEYLQVNDAYSLEIIRSLVQVLIIKLIRIKSKENDILDNKKYLISFFSLQKLVEKECFASKKVSYYANKMGITTKTLNNITQSVIGKSAKSFIDEVVIVQIKRLLINSQFSFSEIAYQAGFDEPTNFFKYFRKKTGLSPKQFKETYK